MEINHKTFGKIKFNYGWTKDIYLEIFIENLIEIYSNFYDYVQDVKDFLVCCQLPSKEEALKELERIRLLL